MASYTGNLNLKKPALDDDALITDINNNMDILDAAVNGIQDGLAIVANGNTHVAITAGQFVYVRNHSTLTEGLYVASTNIAANATLSSSNLTADAAGGLNALNSKITNQLRKIYVPANGKALITVNDYNFGGMICISGDGTYCVGFWNIGYLAVMKNETDLNMTVDTSTYKSVTVQNDNYSAKYVWILAPADIEVTMQIIN